MSVSADANPERAARIKTALYEFIERRARGEAVTVEAHSGMHPDLMPELHEALAGGLNKFRVLLDADRAADPPADSAWPHVKGFAIKDEIGRGGQGVVYQAVQESTGQTVALKVFFAASRHSQQRFEREVKALAELSGAGIVRIIDCGRTSAASHYIAMDFIDGQDLDDWLDEQLGGAGVQRKIVELFVRIADAVGNAHRAGIVHRDLKPSNIRVDRGGNPCILDFGLASMIGSEDRSITQTGNILGSLQWISPEQADGKAARVGPEADVYALGLLLFDGLTGCRPYPVSGALHEITRHVCNTPAADPRRTSQRFGPISDALAAVMLRCLEKRPATRFATGDALAEALRDAADSPAPKSRRKRYAVSALLAATSLALGGWNLARSRAPSEPAGHRVSLPTLVNSIGMRFVQLPAGSFQMGSPVSEAGRQPDEVRHIELIRKPFLMGITEVTQGQYRHVMGKLPGQIKQHGDELPIDFISYDNANRFCEKLGVQEGRSYRLPTEAEWEYACRAGSTGCTAAPGWTAEDSGGALNKVASRAPNAWGLFDMEGNVGEWTRTRMEADRIVARGGSFLDPPANCRSASRTHYRTELEWRGVGFRIALDSSDGLTLMQEMRPPRPE